MNAKQFLAFLITGAATSLVAATTYSWKADASGNYSGNFADPDHWNPAIEGGPGSGYPESSANFNHNANYPRVDADYTVTLPEGVVTNLSTISCLYAQYGHKVTFDGSKTTWVMPTADGNVYGKFQIQSAAVDANGKPKAGPMCFKRYGRDGNAAGLGTFKNFQLILSAGCDGHSGTRLALVGGENDWTDSSVRMFTEGESADARMEFLFKDSTFANFPLMQWGMANRTNVLTFSNCQIATGGGWSFQTVAGVRPNDEPGLFDFTFKNGSSYVATSTGNGFGYADAYAKTFRLNITGGSSLSIGNILFNGKGHYGLNVVGVGSKFKGTANTQQIEFSKAASSTSTVFVADGGSFETTGTVLFGGNTAALAATSCANLIVSNGSFRCGRNMQLYSGTFLLVDDAHVAFFSGEDNSAFHGGGFAGVKAELLADGATLHFEQGKTSTPTLHKTRTMVQDFTAAKIGPKGLTLSGEWSWYYVVPQNFTDWNGAGTLTVCGYSDDYPFELSGEDSRESNLAIARSVVRLAAGANHNSNVIVTNNATFSLVGGATAAEIRSLTLGDASSRGTLALDAGDTVVVSNAISFVKPALAFSSTLGLGTHTVFRRLSQPTEEEIEYWELSAKVSVVSGLPETGYTLFEIVEDDGVWLYNIRILDQLPELEGHSTWKGPGSEWTDETWSDGVPSATRGATFAGGEPKDVTVSGQKVSGAIRFECGDYTISGGTIKLAINDSLAVESFAGKNEVASNLRLGGLADVPVASGELTLSGDIRGGGIAKSGSGTLILSGDNMMPEGFSLSGGILRLLDPAALGACDDRIVSPITGGSLEFLGEGRTIAKTSLSAPVVYRAEADVTMPLPEVTAGAIIKRGAGALALEATADATLKLTSSDDNAGYTKDDTLTFPADGSAPAKYNAITVTEGEFVISGASDGAVPKLTVDGKQVVSVGAPTTEHSGESAVQPGFAVDHANVSVTTINLGSGLAADKTFVREPYLAVRNGGVLSVSTLATPGSDSSVPGVRVLADNGTINSICEFNDSDSAAVTNGFVFANGSALLGYRHAVHGAASLAFSNSVLARDWKATDRTKLSPCAIAVYTLKSGSLDMTFAQGSIFACASIDYSAPKLSYGNPVNLTFDGSEWYPGGDDAQTIGSASLNLSINVTGGGLLLQPAEGKVWTVITRLEGDGGLVKAGAGTVVVDLQQKYHEVCADTATLCCTGTNVVREGLLKITNGAFDLVGGQFRAEASGTVDFDGATVTGAVLSGSGTFRNGTLVRPSIAAEDGQQPLLDFANGLDASGRCVIRFTALTAAELGKEVAVARYSGTLPAGLSFRVKGTTADGSPLGGTVRIADGVIYATPEVRGLMILVR